MCGICGIVNHQGSNPVEHSILQRMADRIRHRGPDDQGFFIKRNIGLAHNRLSIIDLSDAGHQPMQNADGSIQIVFNGEIYNYLELRQQLIGKGYSFKSHTDTEVLLHLYEDKGIECLQQLNGMFAFAIWDNSKKRLFAARDHFGIKPFYFRAGTESFIFASEIKAILEHPDIDVSMNMEALYDYLTFQLCLGEKTLFEGIHKLLPGHYLLIKPGRTPTVNRYWDLDFSIDINHTASYFENKLSRLLEDSVRLQLRSDVPVGAHLSGGLDSSTITMLASSLFSTNISTFSGGFKDGEEFNEIKHARLVSKTADTNHFEVYPTPEDFTNSLPELIYMMDEPAAGPGLFPQYFVSKLAGENVKVVLGGQGGDEMFGGYTRYLIAYLEQCIKGGINQTYEDKPYVVTFESILPNLSQLKGYEPLIKYFWQDGLFEADDRRYFRLIDRGNAIKKLFNKDFLETERNYNVFSSFQDIFNAQDCQSLINKMTHFDLMTLLPALLHVEDRTSMSVSLESRVPLLDYRIAELVAGMPPMVKYKGGRAKHIFREVIKHIVPSEIYNRTDKKGFPVPLSLWMKKEPVRGFVLDTLLGENAKIKAFIERPAVENLVLNEQTFGRGIWGLLCLELWMQNFSTNIS